jgi:hypothetical protein
VAHDEEVGDAKHCDAVQQGLQHARHAVATLEQGALRTVRKTHGANENLWA